MTRLSLFPPWRHSQSKVSYIHSCQDVYELGSHIFPDEPCKDELGEGFKLSKDCYHLENILSAVENLFDLLLQEGTCWQFYD